MRRGDVMSVEEVDRRLEALGVDPEKLNPEEINVTSGDVSYCVRAAIQRGFIQLKGEDREELNQVIFKGNFPHFSCGHSKDVKLCDVLYQPDYGGWDYADGLPNATVRCEEPDCKDNEERRGRMFLTDICKGCPSPDTGEFHNHCLECPGFGVCLGDHREDHCHKCNGHFDTASSCSCPCQDGGREDGSDSDDSDGSNDCER